MSELRDDVREQVREIYDAALRDGYVSDDDICDELGDFFDDVQDSGDGVLKRAYTLARSALEEEHGVAMERLKGALDMLEA